MKNQEHRTGGMKATNQINEAFNVMSNPSPKANLIARILAPSKWKREEQ